MEYCSSLEVKPPSTSPCRLTPVCPTSRPADLICPSGAPHPDLAHKFIDFILDAKIGAQLSNYNYYASPNAAAEPYLDEALKQPPAQPTEEEMKRLRFTPSLEGEQLQTFQQLWSEVQAR